MNICCYNFLIIQIILHGRYFSTIAVSASSVSTNPNIIVNVKNLNLSNNQM